MSGATFPLPAGVPSQLPIYAVAVELGPFEGSPPIASRIVSLVTP